MNIFLWVIIFVLAMSCVGKLIMVATGDFPKRTPMSETIDIVINAALLVWAVVLSCGL